MGLNQYLIAGMALLTLTGCIERDIPAEALPPITTVMTVTTPPPTTTTPPVDPALINDCISWVTYGAYVGNGMAQKMWDDSFRDVVTLARDCQELDLDALEELSRQWNAIQATTTTS